MKIKPTLIAIFLAIVFNLSVLSAEPSTQSSLRYVGGFSAEIQLFGEAVFKAILRKLFDEETLAKIRPYKPKKVIEDPMLAEIEKELNEYNLAFGDLFVATYSIDDKRVIALVLIYGTLEPRIRYYQILETE